MAKKRSSRRHRRRRGSLGPLLRVLSVLLAAVAIVAAITLFFKVDHVEIVGNERYDSQEIVEVSQIRKGDNLILLDKFHIAERLYTELPYISEVSFDRKFPDVLEIKVREADANFAVAGAGSWWLVSMDGKLLETVAQAAGRAYLCIDGVEAEEPVVSKPMVLPEKCPLTAERLLELLHGLNRRGLLEGTSRIDLGDPQILRLYYDDRFVVEFYYTADFDYKLSCLVGTVDRLQPNETGTIRMTMKDDSEVRFIPGTPAS